MERKKYMKKIFVLIFLLNFFLSKIVLATEPEHSDDLNENIIKYGWKLKSTTVTQLKGFPSEIFTLNKDKYILKCIITYRPAITSECLIP